MRDVVKEAVRRLFAKLLPQRYRIEATFIDIEDLAVAHVAMHPNTRPSHAETTTNPTTQVPMSRRSPSGRAVPPQHELAGRQFGHAGCVRRRAADTSAGGAIPSQAVFRDSRGLKAGCD